VAGASPTDSKCSGNIIKPADGGIGGDVTDVPLWRAMGRDHIDGAAAERGSESGN
jgi:hypothetical protein